MLRIASAMRGLRERGLWRDRCGSASRRDSDEWIRKRDSALQSPFLSCRDRQDQWLELEWTGRFLPERSQRSGDQESLKGRSGVCTDGLDGAGDLGKG